MNGTNPISVLSINTNVEDIDEESMFNPHRSDGSLELASFSIKSTPNPTRANIEMLINYINTNREEMVEGSKALKAFEDLTKEVLSRQSHASLIRVLKEHGWTGTRYQFIEGEYSTRLLLQALSNLYLKLKNSQNGISIRNFFGAEVNGLEQVLPFCPDIVLKYLTRNFPLKHDENVVPCLSFTGACMLVDISGFSKFSGEMCLSGLKGLDELRQATNGFLGHFVKTVYEYGGDVISFAGDALICVFVNEDDLMDERGLLGTKIAFDHSGCFRALQCACALQYYKTKTLSTHIGVTSGPMKLALLGGFNEQCVYILNGPCVSELSQCIEDAGPQEVATTPACYSEAIRWCNNSENFEESLHSPTLTQKSPSTGRTVNVRYFSTKDSAELGRDMSVNTTDVIAPLSLREAVEPFEVYLRCDSGNLLIHSLNGPVADSFTSGGEVDRVEAMQKELLDMLRLKRMATNTYKPNSIQLGLASDTSSVRSIEYKPLKQMKSSRSMVVDGFASVGNAMQEQQQEFEFAVARFVPIPVLATIKLDCLEHIGELRQVTTMFLSLDSYSPVTHEDPVTLQPFFRLAQEVLYESGGFLRQFLVDDKGCVLIAMWGMPSFTYANNCSRALHCAVSLSQQAKSELQLDCSVGITTGTVFCGTVGALERRDYAGIGTDVNMAARLMAKAKGRIFLDKLTFENLNQDTKELLMAGDPLVLKGSAQPVQPFIFSGDAVPKVEEIDAELASKHSRNRTLRKKIMVLIGNHLDKISNCYADSLSPINPANSLRNSEATGLSTKSRLKKRAGHNFSHSLIDMRAKLSYAIVLQGPPGTGKSSAGTYFRQSSARRGLQTIHIKAHEMHRSTPYGVIRLLVSELVGESSFSSVEQQQRYIESWVDQIYPQGTHSEKAYAKVSLSMVLGVPLVASETLIDSIDLNDETSKRSCNPRLGKRTFTRRLSSQFFSVKEEVPRESDSASFYDSPEIAFELEDDEGFSNRESGSRKQGDLTCYKLLVLLLQGAPTALLVDHAHFCDELSWNEFYLMLLGSEMDIVILFTIKTSRTVSSKISTSSLYHSTPPGTNCEDDYDDSSLAEVKLDVEHEPLFEDLQLSPRKPKLKAQEQKQAQWLVFQPTQPFHRITQHRNCIVKEMTSLNTEEVRAYLLHTINVDNVSDALVSMVCQISGGNTYWCRAIAHFIKERGVHELEEAVKKDSKQDAMKFLILWRMENLSLQEQLVLKYSSVAGFEFTDHMLMSVMPSRVTPRRSSTRKFNFEPTSNSRPATNNQVNNTEINNQQLEDLRVALESLSRHGYIQCVNEVPVRVFVFQNELMQQILYDLIPPSDASLIHLATAEYIEARYSDDLRKFYPRLGDHYKKSGLKNSKAFKFELKACADAISRSAFEDSLVFAESSLTLAKSKNELEIFIKVMDRALLEMNSPQSRICHRFSRAMSGIATTPRNTQISRKMTRKLSANLLPMSFMLDRETVEKKLAQAFVDLRDMGKEAIRNRAISKNRFSKLELTEHTNSHDESGDFEVPRLQFSRDLSWAPTLVRDNSAVEAEQWHGMNQCCAIS